jgi:predicted nucleic acid-binding protein
VDTRIVQFESILSRHKSVGLDTSIFIYHLEDIRPYSDLTDVLLNNISKGKNSGVISMIALIELLVKPHREGRTDIVDSVEDFVTGLPNSKILPVDMEISKLSAEIRGKYNLLVPDSIHIATSIIEGCDLFVTNDIALKKIGEIKVLSLDDYIVNEPRQ